MKPPRFLLREYAIKELLKDKDPDKFLEFGYGNGNILLTLSRLGFYGDGYDFSEEARLTAEKLLARNRITNIRLLSLIDEKETYDSIFMLEVIGYLNEVIKELISLRKLLKENGRLILSFVKKESGYSSELLGNQRFFSRNEIRELLLKSGFRVTSIWNYGYPLANILVPFLNLSLVIRRFMRKDNSNRIIKVQQTGLVHENVFMKIVGFIINPITIYPFAKMQLLFKNTDLGNGYIVVAKKM